MKSILSPQNLQSPQAVANDVGWPVQRLRKLISSGEIEFIRMGTRLYTTKAAVEEYVVRVSFQPSGGCNEKKN